MENLEFKSVLDNIIDNFSLDIKNLIKKRISEFKALKNGTDQDWFSELCFCILTANSKAKRAIEIQKELGSSGFLHKTQDELAAVIRSHNHRFHNTKASYIFAARKYANIKDLISGMTGPQAREFLVKHIKGIGYKEASHFLRNVGYSDVAIIDRHIIRFMHKYHLVIEIPKVITPKKYLGYEKILANFSNKLDELDLQLWYHMTGTVLK